MTSRPDPLPGLFPLAKVGCGWFCTIPDSGTSLAISNCIFRHEFFAVATGLIS
jgi:hypothetical protein